MENFDIIIIGSGAAGVFAAYELNKLKSNKKVLIIDSGNDIYRRTCPITSGKVKNCIHCKPCNIMQGFGGAGTLSDGKYNITTEFGGELHTILGEEKAISLMEYVDKVMVGYDNFESKLFETASTDLKTLCLKNNLHLLNAKVRHFGTDRNYEILKKIYEDTKNKVTYSFNTTASDIELDGDKYIVKTDKGDFKCEKLVLACGRSGSKWMSSIFEKFNIKTQSNRVDIGVRVELPGEIFKHITDIVYESKIIFKSDKYNDMVRTFCMNPYGMVVAENTNGVITVNGHAYADKDKLSPNTNFALLVSNTFTEPFKNSNEYGESIAKLSNMLGGGVIMQRFGDLVKGRRSSDRRMLKCFTKPTLQATPGDLSLVIPKRQLDSIIEMIYQLDKIAPGTANEDTLLYGVEVKFYNSKVNIDEHFETSMKNLFAIGDGSGLTHSLSQASASGVEIARILNA